jgi:hypothetical protein
VRSRLRPAEVVLLLFVGYCFLRAAISGTFAINTTVLPRGDMVITFVFVLTVRLGLAYRDTPWRPEDVGRRKRHSILLVAFLMVGIIPGIVLFVTIPDYMPHVDSRNGGAATSYLVFFYSSVRDALAFLVPGMFLWLGMGLHIKKHGGFSLKESISESGSAAVDVLRDWTPPLALLYSYIALGPIISQRLFPDRDAALERLDRFLFFGRSPTMLCQSIISAPLSEWLSGCYVFYVPLFPLVLGALFAKHQRGPFREAAFALTLVLAVGYVGYAIVPAIGPVFFETFDRNLGLYYTARLKEHLMDQGRVPRDCFPSLHTGASLTLLWSAARHMPKLAWALSPIVLSIPFACVYLRYHYVVDIIGGLALCAVVMTWTTRSRALQAAFHGS